MSDVRAAAHTTDLRLLLTLLKDIDNRNLSSLNAEAQPGIHDTYNSRNHAHHDHRTGQIPEEPPEEIHDTEMDLDEIEYNDFLEDSGLPDDPEDECSDFKHCLDDIEMTIPRLKTDGRRERELVRMCQSFQKTLDKFNDEMFNPETDGYCSTKFKKSLYDKLVSSIQPVCTIQRTRPYAGVIKYLLDRILRTLLLSAELENFPTEGLRDINFLP